VPRATVARSSTIVDLTLLGISAGVALLATVLPRNVSDPVAAGFRRTVVAPFVALQARAERSREAFYAHESVTARADSIALRAAAANALEVENGRLRELLGLGGRMRWGFVVAEALHMSKPFDANSVTLTAGTSVGVATRSPVVAPEGIVGMVQQVDATTSQAILWSHVDFRVSAMTVGRTAYGIVQPHFGDADVDNDQLSPELRSPRYLELRNVALRDTLARNTLVVSSGLGSTFPAGIPVGYVVREVETPEKWARTYLLRPAVQLADVHSVMVLRPDRVENDVAPVWGGAAKADSLTRGIVATADSAARDSAETVRRTQQEADSARIARQAAAAALARADSAATPAAVPGTTARPDSARRAPATTRPTP